MNDIKSEILTALEEVQSKINSNTTMNDDYLKTLLLTSLIEDEA